MKIVYSMMVLDLIPFVNNVGKGIILMVLNVYKELILKYKIVKFILMIKIDVMSVKVVMLYQVMV